MSERCFNGDLPDDKEIELNILASSEEWVAKNLTNMKGEDLFAQEETKSPGLQLVLATLLFD